MRERVTSGPPRKSPPKPKGADVPLLVLTVVNGALVVVFENPTKQPITVVKAARYYAVEVEDEVGEFVGGVPLDSAAAPGLPSARDYVKIAPKASVEVLRLPIERVGDAPELAVHGRRYVKLAARPRLRATYRAADRAMPNLPRDQQATFFIGPADGASEPQSSGPGQAEPGDPSSLASGSLRAFGLPDPPPS